MKNVVKKVFIAALAILILFVGTGFNVVNFCCSECATQQALFIGGHDGCEDESHFKVADAEKHACCVSHQDQPVTSAEPKSCCADKSTQQTSDACCQVQRVSVDLDNFLSRPHLNNPFVWISANLFPAFSSLLNETFEDVYQEKPLKVPKALLPRVYLSLIRVLII